MRDRQPVPRDRSAPAPRSARRGSGGIGNAAELAAIQAAQARPAPVSPDGRLDYYARRHADYTARHEDGGPPPPAYYMGYGDKYVRRFTEDVGPLLSDPGREWLVKVRAGLQVAMEDERARDPAAFGALEEDDAAFRSFAFETHPQAYWDAGLGRLPVTDLITIGLTPDSEDLLSFDGLVQVGDIVGRLTSAWGADALDVIGGAGTSVWLVEHAYVGFQQVGIGVDAVFGAGAAQALEDAATALGATTAALARGVHHVFATAVTGVAMGVDALAGAGATSGAVNGLRQGAQAGVEQLEDAGAWAAGVWRTLTRGAGRPGLAGD